MAEFTNSNELTASTVAALLNREIGAIVLDDLVSSDVCSRASSAVKLMTEENNYRWSDDLSILGTSIGEAHESEEGRARYLADGARTTRLIRHLIFGGQTPIDCLALELLGVWAPGIRVPQINGSPFLQQVARRWKTGGQANPHIDPSVTELLKPFGITRRLGVNFYSEMPSTGGAVEFWNKAFTEEEYAAARIPSPGYGLSRDVLGEADLKLRPEAGQTIIFDASLPHAVEPVSGCGERITIACFFGFAGETSPLFQFA